MRRLLAATLLGTAAIAGLGVTMTPDPNRPGTTALDDRIPKPALGAYLDAAETWDIDWALLAAVGELECDHGRHRAPGCWPPRHRQPRRRSRADAVPWLHLASRRRHPRSRGRRPPRT